MGMIEQKPGVTAEDLAQRIANIIQSYPAWMATEYPVKVTLGRRHGLESLTLVLSTNRTFDIKIKERKSGT
jgi:hypothetical protein